MDAMVFSARSSLYCSCLFSRSMNKSGGTNFPQRACTIRQRSNMRLGERILSRRNAMEGRMPTCDGKKKVPDPDTRSSKNLEEIISLFRRIRSSISRESTSSKKRSRRSSRDSPSVESVLQVLHKSMKQAKGKTRSQDKHRSSPGGKEPLLGEQKGSSAVLEPISRHPPSKSVRRSPISLQSPGKTGFLGSESLPTTEDATGIRPPKLDDAPMQKVQEMKLPELRQLAKLRGIKGYSKLKKANLVQLLSTL